MFQIIETCSRDFSHAILSSIHFDAKAKTQRTARITLSSFCTSISKNYSTIKLVDTVTNTKNLQTFDLNFDYENHPNFFFGKAKCPGIAGSRITPKLQLETVNCNDFSEHEFFE